MAKLRTFVAIEVPSGVRQRSARLIDTLQEATESVRWVATDSLHVTLKFLGDVEDREIYSVCRAVSNSVADQEPFTISCRGVGSFPSVERPKIIWMGLDDHDEKLTNLFARLDAELSGLGFPREPRKFVPHLTLGRVQHGRRNVGDLTDVMKSLSEYDAGWLDIDSLTVFTSELKKSGPVYTVVGRASLNG